MPIPIPTAAAVVAGGHTGQLPKRLPVGVTKSDIVETIAHLASSVGGPRAMSSIAATRTAFTSADAT